MIPHSLVFVIVIVGKMVSLKLLVFLPLFLSYGILFDQFCRSLGTKYAFTIQTDSYGRDSDNRGSNNPKWISPPHVKLRGKNEAKIYRISQYAGKINLSIKNILRSSMKLNWEKKTRDIRLYSDSLSSLY